VPGVVGADKVRVNERVEPAAMVPTAMVLKFVPGQLVLEVTKRMTDSVAIALPAPWFRMVKPTDTDAPGTTVLGVTVTF